MPAPARAPSSNVPSALSAKVRAMAVRSEVGVRLAEGAGAVSGALERLADVRVAVDAWQLSPDGTLRIVCDNPHLVVELLGSNARVVDVLVAHVASRDLPRLLKRCAAHGVSITHAYTGPADSPDRVLIVLGVPDAARASVQLGR